MEDGSSIFWSINVAIGREDQQKVAGQRAPGSDRTDGLQLELRPTIRSTMMSAITDQIEELYATIDDGTDPRVQRAAVGALIVAALPELEPTPTYWVKAHIAGACSALHDNAIRLNPSTMWLRLSLLDLRHAFLPWDSVNEDYTARNHAIDRMPFSRLARAAMAVVEESVAL